MMKYCGKRTVKRHCIKCSKEFDAIITNASKGIVVKYCSRSCHISVLNSKRVWSQQSKDKSSETKMGKYNGVNNPNFKDATTSFTCTTCSKPFKIPNNVIRSGKHSGKYCSLLCYKSHRETNKKSDEYKRLYKIFGRNISHSLRYGKKRCKWTELVGYSLSELKAHLESLFTDGMAWDNYGRGGWNVDHKKPLSWFNFSDFKDDEFKKAWALDNLQPLWQTDNYKKGNRYEG